MVVGEAGIGKTSILYWMGLQIVNGNINSKFIPLFIPLKSITDKATSDELFSVLETRYNIKKYYLKDYKILFLLDGLDQMADYSNIRERLKEKDIFGQKTR